MHPLPPHNKAKKILPYIIFIIKNFNKKIAVRVFFSKYYGFCIIIRNSGFTAYSYLTKSFNSGKGKKLVPNRLRKKLFKF